MNQTTHAELRLRDGVYATSLPGSNPPPSQVTIDTIYAPNGLSVNDWTKVPTSFRVTGTVIPNGATVTGRLWDVASGAWLPSWDGGGPIQGQSDPYGNWGIAFSIVGVTLPRSFYLKVCYLSTTDPSSAMAQIQVVANFLAPSMKHTKTGGKKTHRNGVNYRIGHKPEHAADKAE